MENISAVSNNIKDKRVVTLGTRKSKLALVQTQQVFDWLSNRFSSEELEFRIKEISTVGDKILDKPLSEIGDKGLFTKELEEALWRKEIDLAVHSLKDVQTTLPRGLVLGAISEREDQRDVVILKTIHKEKGLGRLDQLPAGSNVGTSSLRRVAQLKRRFPNLNFKTIRGNLQTRLSKLENEDYDALILAFAGINRLGLSHVISEVLSPEMCYPAVGQGALAVECREGDEFILSLLRTIHHPETALCCHAERAFMKHLEGGCLTPIACFCEIETTQQQQKKKRLVLKGRVLSLDGSQCIEAEEVMELDDDRDGGEEQLGCVVGVRLAESLKRQGAEEILAQIDRSTGSKPITLSTPHQHQT